MIESPKIVELHDATVAAWHAGPIANPYSGFLALVCEQHQFNFQLWHEEDIARSPEVTDARIAQVKRAIDRYNQQRNDAIERLDDFLVAELASRGVNTAADAPLNTETPGSAIDRLSIIALRIYHMREQADRADASAEHRAKAEGRLAILGRQRADLANSLDELSSDIFAGHKRLAVYRQFKMYNDPTLNPYLYSAGKRPAEQAVAGYTFHDGCVVAPPESRPRMKPITTKNARRRFTAARDENGVPHIQAASWQEALYGLGYVHAIDRPTQMLFARAVASGRSAELLVDRPELVETDRFFRRTGLHLRLEEEAQRLDDATFEQLTAYCEGVNDGWKDERRSLPMWAAGFERTPWNQQSVLLIGRLLSFGGLVVGQQQNERIILDLIKVGIADDKLRELFHPMLNHADFDLIRKLNIASQLSDEALELISDLPRLVGSNAWVVSPWRSATGAALLASDPHLEINRLPAIWYEASLEWDGGHYLLGATLPGCPLFAVARTEKVAWGCTYLKGDTSDYFIEDCRPGGETGWQYRRGREWRDFQLREEPIVRKGGPTESLRVYFNEQGTLDSDLDPGTPGYYLSSAWVGAHDGGTGASIATWLQLPGVANVADGLDIVRECPMPTLCWLLADRAGHIGKQANGWFPRRGGDQSGLLPIPAWDERNHWRGLLSTDSLPRVYDPPEGFIASANEDINPARGPQLISLTLPDYRYRRIVERLEALPQVTMDDMKALQYDVLSTQARDLLPVFLPNLPDGRLKERLAAWDCRYNPESIEATMFSRLYMHIVLEVFGHEQGIGWRRMLYMVTRIGFSTMVLTCIDRLLLQEHSFWWQSRGKESLIRRAGERVAKMPDQPWSVTNGFRFTNRFVEGFVVGRALGLHTAEMGLPGNHATPFQGHLLKSATRTTTFAPSYHFVTDLATDVAHTNLPGGPSESVTSGFYKNDIPRWRAGEYKLLTTIANGASGPG